MTMVSLFSLRQRKSETPTIALRVGAVALMVAGMAQMQLTYAVDTSAPIAGVEIGDKGYKQIASSYGDTWAPTWAKDDALYTASDDGTSFGGVATNALAFGSLVGKDPAALEGRTISGMREFAEPERYIRRNASWSSLKSLRANGKLFRFRPCGTEVANSCLEYSGNGGVSWKTVQRTEAIFGDGRVGSPEFIQFREFFFVTTGNSADEYAYAAAKKWPEKGVQGYVVGRVPRSKLSALQVSDWSYQVDDTTWTSKIDEAKAQTNAVMPFLGSDGANWKAMNTYSVDGVLYMFITRCFYPFQAKDPAGRHIYKDSSVIKSTDGGRTWSRDSKENRDRPMFPGGRFGAPYFIWYGKDGAASVHNADLYVYAVSNDGHYENGDDYVLGRVLRSRLPRLRASDWSFYRGGDGMAEQSWTANLEGARSILRNPGKSGAAGITYLSGLGRYIMLSWHFKFSNWIAAIQAGDMSTIIEVFESPYPWGPWRKVQEEDTGEFGWYEPVIGQRFQETVGQGTVRAYVYATGFTASHEHGLVLDRYKLNYFPITISTQVSAATPGGGARR